MQIARDISDDAWVSFNRRIEDMQERFQRFMGWWTSNDAYHRQVRSLLKAAFTDVQFGAQKSITVQLPEWESGVITISYDRGRPAKWGIFGKMDEGRAERLVIRNGNSPESVWFIGSIPMSTVNPIFKDLLAARELPGDAYWSMCYLTTAHH